MRWASSNPRPFHQWVWPWPCGTSPLSSPHGVRHFTEFSDINDLPSILKWHFFFMRSYYFLELSPSIPKSVLESVDRVAIETLLDNHNAWCEFPEALSQLPRADERNFWLQRLSLQSRSPVTKSVLRENSGSGVVTARQTPRPRTKWALSITPAGKAEYLKEEKDNSLSYHTHKTQIILQTGESPGSWMQGQWF